MFGIGQQHPIPPAGHLVDARLDLGFDKRFHRLGQDEAEAIGTQTIDRIHGRSQRVGERHDQGGNWLFLSHFARTIPRA